jgi:hypothetical protein
MSSNIEQAQMGGLAAHFAVCAMIATITLAACSCDS